MKGNLNSPLHSDYLNNKMKSVKRRHPELKHASPYKLRHTGVTLAKQTGTSIEAISEDLTHSDTITTKTYVKMSFQWLLERLLIVILKSNGVNFTKNHPMV